MLKNKTVLIIFLFFPITLFSALTQQETWKKILQEIPKKAVLIKIPRDAALRKIHRDISPTYLYATLNPQQAKAQSWKKVHLDIKREVELKKERLIRHGGLEKKVRKRFMDELQKKTAHREEHRRITANLKEQNMDPNSMSEAFGKSQLSAAVYPLQDPRLCRQLLHIKADPNKPDAIGRTVLHNKLTPRLAHLLLENGADPEEKDDFGRNALHAAAAHQSPADVLQYLADKCDPYETDDEENTALHLALSNKHQIGIVKKIKVLLSPVKADDIPQYLKRQNEDDESALSLAPEFVPAMRLIQQKRSSPPAKKQPTLTIPPKKKSPSMCKQAWEKKRLDPSQKAPVPYEGADL